MSSTECPFCHQPNRCTANSSGCWCQVSNIPNSLIDLLPDSAINKTCICVICIESYQKNPTAFKAQINGKAE